MYVTGQYCIKHKNMSALGSILLKTTQPPLPLPLEDKEDGEEDEEQRKKGGETLATGLKARVGIRRNRGMMGCMCVFSREVLCASLPSTQVDLRKTVLMNARATAHLRVHAYTHLENIALILFRKNPRYYLIFSCQLREGFCYPC